ncbi:hypothetical protein ACCT09_56675, partial [Rhizobium ruizarguesonis]
MLDLDKVWNEQAVPKAMLHCLLRACAAAACVITAPESGIRNITEWAKKQACWASVMRTDPVYCDELQENMIDPEDAK